MEVILQGRGKEEAIIFIDQRRGSAELAPLINDSVLVQLEYGDCFWIGNGPNGDVDIGVERKTVGDLINSISTGRLSGHQIPGLTSRYYRSYLIIEGRTRENACTGELEVEVRGKWTTLDRGGRRFSWKGMWAYLTTIETMTGITIRETENIRHTASLIKALHDWWQKPWDKHTGHLLMYKPRDRTAAMGMGKPSLVRRVAAELPAIGWVRSRDVEKKFKTIKSMVDATVDDWRSIPGIGAVTAKTVVEAIHGE